MDGRDCWPASRLPAGVLGPELHLGPRQLGPNRTSGWAATGRAGSLLWTGYGMQSASLFLLGLGGGRLDGREQREGGGGGSPSLERTKKLCCRSRSRSRRADGLWTVDSGGQWTRTRHPADRGEMSGFLFRGEETNRSAARLQRHHTATGGWCRSGLSHGGTRRGPSCCRRRLFCCRDGRGLDGWMELMGERGCDPELELPPVSVPSAHFQCPVVQSETRNPGWWWRWRVEGKPQPVEGQRAERVWARRVCDWRNQKDGQCRGVDDGDWHCQQGWGACSPKNALTEDGPDLKVQARLPCHPVAQGPVSSGRPGPCCIRCEKGGSVGPVWPLLPGVAVQFSLTCHDPNSARAFVPSFFFVFCLARLLSAAPQLPHPLTRKRSGEPLSTLASGRGAGTTGGDGDGSAWASDGSWLMRPATTSSGNALVNGSTLPPGRGHRGLAM